MIGGEHMTDFLTADTNLPSYMMFPRFLLDMEINETAKMLYIILLDRARLSQKNEGWSDIDGHVFIYFTIEALAEVLHKSQMTVKTALAVLEKQELILVIGCDDHTAILLPQLSLTTFFFILLLI